MAELREHGIVSFCSLPLTTARRRIGALGFGSREPVTYTAAEVGFLGEVAKLVAVAVDNALNFDHAQATQRQLSTERDHLRLLLEVTNAMVSNLDLPRLVDAISSSLERAIPHEFTALALYDKDSGELVVHAAAAKSSDGRSLVGRRIPVVGSAAGEAFTARRTLLFGEDDLTGRLADTATPMREAGIRSVCAVPLVVGDRGLGTLTVGNLQPDAFTPESVAMIEEVVRRVAMAVANALAFREIAQLTEKLAEERLYLESEIRAEHPFAEIVGESRLLRDALQQVEIVAPSDATVLVLGETGTGKELIARAIHDRSGRRERTFVKINCAAIPSGLVEERRFRADLYYRLNVFPIHVPPLRERPEDVPALARFFVQRLARPMNRHVEVIATETLDVLRRYAWPGNVRELANLIERAMILSKGRTLEVPLAELRWRRPRADHADGPPTLDSDRVDRDRDLGAHCVAGVRDAEVPAVDRGRGMCARTAPLGDRPLDVEDHRACRPAQREVPGHPPVVAVRLVDSRGLECDSRIARDVEEVSAAQVSVTLGLIRVDRARVDHRLDRPARRIPVVQYHAPGREAERTVDVCHREILDRKRDPGRRGIEGPRRGASTQAERGRSERDAEQCEDRDVEAFLLSKRHRVVL